jgi:hypothetical protein
MSEELKRHLAAKERSVADLVQFVNTRTDKGFKITLFFWAPVLLSHQAYGRAENSSTSGGRNYTTGLCSKPVAPYDVEEARRYLAREHADWYSPQREYSSLFEKKFDLPRQRRMFVENEVLWKDAISWLRLSNFVLFREIFAIRFSRRISMT